MTNLWWCVRLHSKMRLSRSYLVNRILWTWQRCSLVPLEVEIDCSVVKSGLPSLRHGCWDFSCCVNGVLSQLILSCAPKSPCSLAEFPEHVLSCGLQSWQDRGGLICTRFRLWWHHHGSRGSFQRVNDGSPRLPWNCDGGGVFRKISHENKCFSKTVNVFRVPAPHPSLPEKHFCQRVWYMETIKASLNKTI